MLKPYEPTPLFPVSYLAMEGIGQDADNGYYRTHGIAAVLRQPGRAAIADFIPDVSIDGPEVRRLAWEMTETHTELAQFHDIVDDFIAELSFPERRPCTGPEDAEPMKSRLEEQTAYCAQQVSWYANQRGRENENQWWYWLGRLEACRSMLDRP